MKIVLDTNVLVSGLLNPFGVPGSIVRMMGSPGIVLCVDARILAEYREVIRRPRFQIDPAKAEELMDCIRHAVVIYPAAPLAHRLSDEDDEPFLAVAVSARVDCLVTGNLKHYPAAHRQGVKVVSPVEFMTLCTGHRTGA